MIIHSITPAQLLMSMGDEPQPTVRKVGGAYMEGYETAAGFELSRLNSTDPAMYLDPKYAPGSMMPGQDPAAQAPPAAQMRI